MFKIEIEKILRLGAESQPVLARVKDVVDAWSGADEDLVSFYEPQSLRFQLVSPPFAYWRIDGRAFEEYGPLPFTAEGKPIRWSWLYWLRNAPTLTVTDRDLSA